MTNHPNRAKSYWFRSPRRFQNEYVIGVATSAADAEQYEAEDFERIDRDVALTRMSRRAGNGETLYVTALVDGEDIEERTCGSQDRFMLARLLRRGEI